MVIGGGGSDRPQCVQVRTQRGRNACTQVSSFLCNLTFRIPVSVSIIQITPEICPEACLFTALFQILTHWRQSSITTPILLISLYVSSVVLTKLCIFICHFVYCVLSIKREFIYVCLIPPYLLNKWSSLHSSWSSFQIYCAMGSEQWHFQGIKCYSVPV